MPYGYQYNDTYTLQFTVQLPAYEATSGRVINGKFYVRGFTGLTETEALSEKMSAGGGWITFSQTSRSVTNVIYLYSWGRIYNQTQPVYARIEVYWPGYKQKEIKYTKPVALCSRGRISTDTRHDTITVSLEGIASTKYITYGAAKGTLQKVRETSGLTNYNQSLEKREIIVDSTTTSSTFYNVFRSGTTWDLLTAQNHQNKVLTTKQVAGSSSENKCDYEQECITNTECWADRICTSDACSTDCEDCRCYSSDEAECDGCYHDCDRYSCNYESLTTCKCESADYDYDDNCTEDNGIFDFCVYLPMDCLFGGHAHYDSIWTDGYNYYDEDFDLVRIVIPPTISVKDISFRIEGALGNAISQYIPVVVFDTKQKITYDNHYRGTGFKGFTGGFTSYNYSNIQVSYGSYSGTTSTVFNKDADFDVTVGNAYIRNNSTGTNILTATTSTSTAKVRVLTVNIGVLRLYRLRVYNAGTLTYDFMPYLRRCSNGVTDFETSMGLKDEISGEFFQAVSMSSDTPLTLSCPPSNAEEGDAYEVECLKKTTGSASGFTVTTPTMTLGNFSCRIKGYTTPADIGENTVTKAMLYAGSRYWCLRLPKDDNVSFLFTGATPAAGNSIVWSRSATTVNTLSRGSYWDITLEYRKLTDNLTSSAYTNNRASGTGNTVNSVTIGMNYFEFNSAEIYNSGTLVMELKPYIVIENGAMVQKIKDEVSGSFYSVGTPWDTCMPIIDDSVNRRPSLKCYNGESLFYSVQHLPGETIDASLIGTPAKAGHTFTGWNPAIPATMPNEDYLTYAQFSINSYTITYYFKNTGQTNYSLYTSQTYQFGAAITAPTPTTPSGYEFSGWHDVLVPSTMPANNITTYGEMLIYVPSHNVNYYSGSTSWGSSPTCNKFDTVSYREGETISYPSIGSECYPSYGWKKTCTTGGTAAQTTMGTSDINVYCVTGYKTSTIYWRVKKQEDSSYTVASTQTAEYGDTISSGPDLSSSAPSGYYWAGWGGADNFTMPCSDKYVDSLYISNVATYYTITYLADNEVFATQQYVAGQSVSAPSKPSGSCSDATTGCKTWSNWAGVPSTMPSNNVTATTTSTLCSHTYKIIINNAGGGTETWFEESLVYGAAVPSVSMPTDRCCVYRFSSNPPSTMPCSDRTISVTETRVQNTVKWYKANGTTVYATQYYYSGDTISAPAVYSKTGYDVSWPSYQSTMGCSSLSYTAIETIHTWTITWYKGSNIVYTTQQYNYGATINPPSPPTDYVWDSYPSTMPDNNVSVTSTYSVCQCHGLEIICSCDPQCIDSSPSYYTATIMVSHGTSVVADEYRITASVGSYGGTSYSSTSQYGGDSFDVTFTTNGTTVYPSGTIVANIDGNWQNLGASVQPSSINLSNGGTYSMTVYTS